MALMNEQRTGNAGLMNTTKSASVGYTAAGNMHRQPSSLNLSSRGSSESHNVGAVASAGALTNGAANAFGSLATDFSNPTGISWKLYLVAKRALDIIVSSAALLVAAPIGALIALCIVVEDRGPIFYCQTRVGRDGRLFRFYKFRSMVRNADEIKKKLMEQNEASGPIFKMKNDPRITRIGRFIRRFSLDELPQFWNVLRGDMSLVGPRPHLPVEVAKYTERQKARLTVQPGLLCLREIQGRSNLTFDKWIETDLQYINSRSLQTDLRILLNTIPAVLKADGAY